MTLHPLARAVLAALRAEAAPDAKDSDWFAADAAEKAWRAAGCPIEDGDERDLEALAALLRAAQEVP